MADRNEILINFQECTGLENLEECINVLESHDWNLVEAIQSTMTHIGGDEAVSEMAATGLDIPPVVGVGYSSPTETTPAKPPSPFIDLTAGEPSPVSRPQVIVPSPFIPKINRLINFTIEYRDREISLVLSDKEKVSKIKELLVEEVNVPPDDMRIGGWINRTVRDTDVLQDLNLPKDVRLHLLTPLVSNPTVIRPSCSAEMDMLEKLDKDYQLDISVKSPSKKYVLTFKGSKTVKEVKNDVYCLTDIPCSQQAWNGWPEAAKDEHMTLAGVGINFPSHKLEMSRVVPNRSPKADMSIGESDDEFEDCADVIFDDDSMEFERDAPCPTKPKSLLPEEVIDDTAALEHFTSVFSERYGECHPVFYIGPLENAIKDSLLVNAKDRKLFCIYIHHDHSVLSNIFCSQVLCSESIVNFLAAHFYIWGWDITHGAQARRFQAVCTNLFGSVTSSMIQNYDTSQLPLLLVITRNKAAYEVFTVIQGNVTASELMSQLIHAVDVFEEVQSKDILEENARADREQIITDQEKAYQESLAIDKAKAEAKKREEDEKHRIEAEQQKMALDEEKKQKEIEELREAERQSLANDLTPEPSGSEECTVLRIRAPDGQTLMRKFKPSDPIKHLFTFVTVKGYHLEDYKLITTYPRRDISGSDDLSTFKEMKLCPQETLILEER